jgi:hypothetical protein
MARRDLEVTPMTDPPGVPGERAGGSGLRPDSPGVARFRADLADFLDGLRPIACRECGHRLGWAGNPPDDPRRPGAWFLHCQACGAWHPRQPGNGHTVVRCGRDGKDGGQAQGAPWPGGDELARVSLAVGTRLALRCRCGLWTLLAMTPDGLWRDAANLFEERIFAHVRRRIATVAGRQGGA